MIAENRTVTKITEQSQFLVPLECRVTEEQLRMDCYYCLAQKMIKTMRDKGLISDDEFNKITQKNRQSFSPSLLEIMP